MKFISNRNIRLGESVLSGVHSSGLRVWIMPKAAFHKSVAYLAVGYGSVDRTFGVAGQEESVTLPDGVAHFLEHEAFYMPSGDRALDGFSAYGADANAYTDDYETVYYFTASERLYESLGLLLQMVNEQGFNEENIEKEKKIITEEITMYEDDPDWRVYHELMDAMYFSHPIKTDIAGTSHSVFSIDRTYLEAAHRSFYVPSNMMLVLVGDWDAERVGEQIDNMVSGEAFLPPIHQVPEEPREILRPSAMEYALVSMPHFAIGYKDSMIAGTPEEIQRRSIVTELLLSLAVGKTSQLNERLSLAGDIYGDLEYEFLSGRGFAFVVISGESDYPESIGEALQTEFSRVAEEGFPAEAVERAKKAAYGQFVRSFDDPCDLGSIFVRDLFAGIDPLAEGEIILSITGEELKERARELFHPEQRAISMILPHRE